ncbi:uncharacterized protein (TIGR03083 family) [Streptomyces sp. 3330]|nr:uncharacterized protein (TIGR03083 family) [Streptomyces sp. 3330]
MPHDLVDDVFSPGPDTPAPLDAWLAEGAAELTGALLDAGPDAPVWTVAPGGTARFWARRMTHETTLHAADAAFVTGSPFAVREDLARDALDEWMGFGSLPRVLEAAGPDAPPLTGPGRTLHLHATDTGQAEWLVDLTAEPIAWSHAHEKAAVAVRAPLTDLVLLLYGRRTPADPSVEVHGDTALLTRWLERSGFWLRKQGRRGGHVPDLVRAEDADATPVPPPAVPDTVATAPGIHHPVPARRRIAPRPGPGPARVPWSSRAAAAAGTARLATRRRPAAAARPRPGPPPPGTRRRHGHRPAAVSPRPPPPRGRRR